jgi:hypothetical protein
MNSYKILYSHIFRKYIEKIEVWLNFTRIMGILHDYLCSFIISRWTVLNMSNISDTIVEKIKIPILCSTNIFWQSAIYEIMWKNLVESARPQMTIWHMRIACWIPKATQAHSEYVILITFALKHWLHGSASFLYFFILCCLVNFSFSCRDVRWYHGFLSNVKSCNSF